MNENPEAYQVKSEEYKEGEEEYTRKRHVCHSYFSLFLLSMVLVSFTWSRNLLYEAYGYHGKGDHYKFYDLKADVPTLTDSNYGGLASLSQSLTFAPCTLIAGGITDKVNRKNLVLLTGILGGLSTAGNYFAANN